MMVLRARLSSERVERRSKSRKLEREIRNPLSDVSVRFRIFGGRSVENVDSGRRHEVGATAAPPMLLSHPSLIIM